MTNLTNLNPSDSFGDLLTTTNAGRGLTVDLQPLQDGLGNSSSVKLSTTASQFLNNLIIPYGTTEERPEEPQTASIYFNTDTENLQIFYNDTWNDL
jgi:hypothetical protein